MQDRYAGDVGDFGKLGMLRCMEDSGLRVGVNWYLVHDESHNNDGKHIGYLENAKYAGCDDELLVSLNSMLKKGVRTVLELEKLNLLDTQKYYNERMIEPSAKTEITRQMWHQNGLETMSGCDLVFLDPDNGMLPKSVSKRSDKSIKYVLPEEILDYYEAGQSVVFYSHRTREQLDVYLERFAKLFDEARRKGAIIKGVTFKRGTVRDYFYILKEKHCAKVERGLGKLLGGKWSRHFDDIQIMNDKSTITVVAAVIKFENKIFATKRGYGEFKGYWEFPGGKVEEAETLEEALLREIREELDTEIAVGDLIDTIEYDYPNFHLSLHCFWATIVSGHLTLKEHEAAKWLSVDELDSVEWLPADITLIEKIKQCLLCEEYK